MDKAKSQISDLERKEEKKHSVRTAWGKNYPKIYKDSVSSLWDNFKLSNILIIEMPEGEEKQQEIENSFDKMMKENFPNLVKEVDIQVQETESPKQDGPKQHHTKIHHS